MVKGTAASTMLKRLDNERALKGVQSLSSIFQKVRSGAVSGACAHPNALAFVCFVVFRAMELHSRLRCRVPHACSPAPRLHPVSRLVARYIHTLILS